jgi:hypothetical protein
METWNEICFLINQYRKPNATERDFQIEAENIFEKLGWKRYRGEIISQEIIPIGSAHNLKPDIIIRLDSNNLFVVELKKPNAGIKDRNADQLISYMLQLRLQIGILLGDTLQIFFDSPDDNIRPIKIFEIEFESDNEDGAQLISLLSKQSYSNDALLAFCHGKLQKLKDTKISEDAIDELTSTVGANLVKGAIRETLNDKYSHTVIDNILDRITITITDKSKQRLQNAHAQYIQIQNQESIKTELTARESFPDDPYPATKVGKLADTVLRDILSRGSLSQSEIDQLQDKNSSKSLFGINYPLLVESNSQFEERRYYRKSLSINGSTYYISSQWYAHSKPLLVEWILKHKS